MEQNYTESLRTNKLNEDALLMQQIVGDDYELLVIDAILRSSFSVKESGVN